MKADFVACISYGGAIFGKGFEGMARLQSVR
jgi:hypothetical protein